MRNTESGRPRSLKRYWEIVGYHGTRKIYEREVPYALFSDRRMDELLRALAAHTGLTLDETVGAYARRGSLLANELLAIQAERSGSRSCGHSHYFIARVVER